MITEASYYTGCVLMAAPIFISIAIAYAICKKHGGFNEIKDQLGLEFDIVWDDDETD